LFYRTIPERFTNKHKAPWIGKGYIRIRGRNATPAIAGWDGEGLHFNSMKIKLANEQSSVIIQSDYVIEE
jgi:hypothetical protein